MQEQLVEAAMELGNFDDNYHEDQFADPLNDDGSSSKDEEEDPELHNVPCIFSKYFRPANQQ
jgi:hypothetical protein